MKQRPEWVKFMKEQYPPGTRIRLKQMNDPYAPVPPNTEGTVDFVDDIGQLHMKWDNGRTLALIPGEDSFSKIPQTLQTLKLYMPLTAMQYERDKWGSLEEYPTELDQGTILSYHDQIFAAILKERMPEESERGLMKYYHEDDSINQKVKSLFFTVERVDNKLMGVAECRAQGKLSDAELECLKDYASGQASSKYVLSDILICGECSHPYRRQTWSRNGKLTPVWRCESRLLNGTKTCKHSPHLKGKAPARSDYDGCGQRGRESERSGRSV